MGSSGMKRKGRQHLPKAGTRPSNEREHRAERAEHMHPFSSKGASRGTNVGVIAAIVAVLVVLAVVGLVAFG